MTHASSTGRDALISGLRGIADYLAATPEVPVTGDATVFAFPPHGEWAAMCAEIDGIAAILGVTARLTRSGHYVATRWFGPVDYRAVAIPPKKSSSKESE